MMEGLRNFRALCLVILSISISCLSEARHHSHNNKANALLVGAVFCETCFQDDLSKGSHYISGATVAVECAQGPSKPTFYQEIKTNKQGKFKVQLPFSISKHVKKIEGCTVKLVKSSEPYCAVASTATSSLIHLKDRKGGKHIFSAGFFTFKPLKQPGLCNQQPSVTNSQLNSLGDFFQTPQLPSIPNLTNPPKSIDPNIPLIPKLPTLPGVPTPGKRVDGYKYKKVDNGFVKQSKQSIFPPFFPPVIPNPLQPPPAPLIPNPLQPPVTPAPLIPNPFQPPSPPPSLLPPLPNLPNLPPIPGLPGLTPPPPPPPPPSVIPGLIPPVFHMPPLIPGFPPHKAKKVNP